MIRIGDLHRLRGSERERVRLAPYDVDLGMRLQEVLRQLEALILVPPLAPELAHDLDVGKGLERFGAALRAIDLRGRALLSVDDEHLSLAAGPLGDPGADLFRKSTLSVAMKVSPGAPSALRSTLITGTPAARAAFTGTAAAVAPAGM